MMARSRTATLLFVGSLLMAVIGAPARAEAEGRTPLDRIRLPDGFRIERIADVAAARGMTWSPAGTLYIGTRSGAVYAATGYGRGPLRLHRLARDLEQPVGVAFRDGDLYISAVSRILRLRDIEQKLEAPPAPEVVSKDFPDERQHGWKFIAFGPDGLLYVPVGAPCNICVKDADRYAVITRLDVNRPGAKPAVVARGVRNTVGFDWQPQTRELWFTDNGRDLMGDDTPPDELNRLKQVGQHFGFPFCHGRNIADPDYGRRDGCAQGRAPEVTLDAHGAALGMRFYTGAQFPPAYRGSIFIAQHGSWNRSRKSGYRVLQVTVDEQGRAGAAKVFASGWLDEATQKAWGRPADVSVAPDGALLVSDDHAGAIYRISYRP
jgi:glucose/arabinose dehydrogenase